MSTGPVTVGTDTYRITSTGEKAEDMIAALEAPDPKLSKPRVISKEPVEEEKDETSQAASVLGKKGGEAAAKARKAEAKDVKAKAKDAPDTAAEPQEAAETKPVKAEGDKEEAEPGKDKKGNPRHDPEARIAVLARDKREAEQRAERAERELEQERRARTAPAAAPKEERRGGLTAGSEDVNDDPEPDLATYDGPDAYERFVKDSGRHAARQEYRAMEQQTQERQREHARGEHIHSSVVAFSDRVAKAAEADQNFLEKTADLASRLQPSFTRAEGQQLTPVHVISDEIIKSDNSAGLMLHFTDNPEEFQRIAALRTPAEIQRAVARIEGYLERDRSAAVTADTSAKRETSRAGTPVRSVAGTPTTDAGELDDDTPFSVRVKRYGERELAASRR